MHTCMCQGGGEQLNRKKGDFALRLNYADLALKGSLSDMGRGKSYEHPTIRNFCHITPTSGPLPFLLPHLEHPSSRLRHIHGIALKSQVKCHLFRGIDLIYFIEMFLPIPPMKQRKAPDSIPLGATRRRNRQPQFPENSVCIASAPAHCTGDGRLCPHGCHSAGKWGTVGGQVKASQGCFPETQHLLSALRVSPSFVSFY